MTFHRLGAPVIERHDWRVDPSQVITIDGLVELVCAEPQCEARLTVKTALVTIPHIEDKRTWRRFTWRGDEQIVAKRAV